MERNLFLCALLLFTCPQTTRALRFAKIGPLRSLSASGSDGKGETFKGGLLGVSAEVVLYREAQFAVISLSGIPVGGHVSGNAEFGRDQDDIVIHEPLRGVLRRRFVKIVNAHYDEASGRVLVTARLPLGLGTHTITLCAA